MSVAPPKIEIVGLAKRYDGSDPGRPDVLGRIDLTVAENEFVSLVGRSGCGKTTLLNIIAGLVAPSAGAVRVSGKPVMKPGDGKGMVFQQHALFPWLTALQNVQFGTRARPLLSQEKKREAEQLLKLVGLSAYANHYPAALSGGMQQRVAIARALALDPQILLMDEPFGALDEITRIDMQHELLRVWSSRRKTIVFVTHSISEALMLSDRVVVMSAHPGAIATELRIALPRPRRPTHAEMVALHDQIWRYLN